MERATDSPSEASGSETSQAEVIAFLGDPANHGMSEPVKRIDTHAAIVFLAGEHAFKLKRAVRYAYLDFSTCERRRQVCEAELELNRRTAPDLYLEVRSVNRLTDGTLSFAAGSPEDWVVVMKRFAPGSLLEEVAARDGLASDLVRNLADEIARFHGAAAVSAETGGAQRVQRVIEGNADSFARLSPELLPAEARADVLARSLAECGRLAGLLDLRGSTGHVRHCHGDLHLANICLWHGRPTLFDCLEFDAELATVDVLYDLAFLVMDMWHRGYRSAASELFNRYLDMTDETPGLGAMPLFLSMRAAIRAHVSAAAAGRQPSEEARRRKLEAARSYLCAAGSFLDKSHPRLIAIGGLSGSGKSTIAARLAPLVGGALGARRLRSDVLRKRMAGRSPETRLPADAYTAAAHEAVYRRLGEEACTTLAAGRSVIVDAVFARADERANIAHVADRAAVPFVGLWLHAPRTVLVARVASRHGDASDADPTVVDRQMAYDVGDIGEWRSIDASPAVDDVVDAAIGALK